MGRVAEKEPVNRLRSFERDDENDTRMFDKLEEYVLEHYPNPQRIGCLDHNTLSAFVETPEKLDLGEVKYLHIFKCAECTRDLRELRRIREGRLQQSLTSSSVASSSAQEKSRKWKQWFAKAAELACTAAIRIEAWWKAHSRGPADHPSVEDAVPEMIDLSGELSIGTEPVSHEHPITLPRKVVDLHLVLPVGSPAGIYRITVAKERGLRGLQADGSASAILLGSQTELDVKLDLRQVTSGAYFLGVVREQDRVSHDFPLLID